MYRARLWSKGSPFAPPELRPVTWWKRLRPPAPRPAGPKAGSEAPGGSFATLRVVILLQCLRRTPGNIDLTLDELGILPLRHESEHGIGYRAGARQRD